MGRIWGQLIATSLGEVIVSFGATTAPFANAINSMVGMMGTWQTAAIAAGIAVEVAIGSAVVSAVKMAADFQSQVTMLLNTAGNIKDSTQNISQSIMNVSASTGTAKDQLVSAMYSILSSGYHAADAMRVLQASAELAKIGMGNAGEAAKAVTTVMHDYAYANITAEQAASLLLEVHKHGKVEMDALNSSLATVLPTASQLHIRLSDVGAAISTMTVAGISAQKTTMELNAMFLSFVKPTKQMNDALASVGLTSSQVSDMMRTNLPGALATVTQRVKDNYKSVDDQNKVLREIFPNQRAYAAALALTGSNMKAFSDNARETAAAMRNGKALQDAWAKTQDNMNVQLNKLKESLSNVAIMIGTALLPYITAALKAVMPLVEWFMKWIQQGDNLRAVMIAIGVVLFPLIELIVVVGGAILGVVEIVAAGIFIFYKLGDAFLYIRDRASTLGGFLPWVGQQFSNLGSLVHGVVSGMLSFITGIFSSIQGFMSSSMHNAASSVIGAFGAMVSGVLGAVGNILGAVASIPGRIGGILGGLAGQAFSWGANLISGFISGIASMIGGVVSAVSNVAGVVASHLGIHSPAEMGPMSDADTWAPNLMKMLTTSILAGTPAFNAALANVGKGGIGVPTAVGVPAGIAGAGGAQYITIELDGQQLIQYVGNGMAKDIRLKLGIR